MQEYKVVSHDIPLGHRWEHHARRIVFDISAWVETFGAGTAQLLHQRQGDEYPYPVTITRTDADGVTDNTTGTLVRWDVTNTDTAQVCRYGKAELRYYRGTQVAPEFLAKSDIYRTTVENALGGALATPPEESPDWLATLLASAGGVDDQVEAARGYAESAGQSADAAQGYAGNAQQSAASAQSYAGNASASAQAAEHHKNVIANMHVWAESLPASSEATVRKIYLEESIDFPEQMSLEFGIPRGADGVSVTDVSQTVTSSESGGVNTVTLTLSDGTTRSFNVANGARGDTGEPFRIAKTYASVAAMNADAASVASGAFVVIASDTEDPDNAKLYVRSENGFAFLTDLSGARGIQGPAGADGVSVSTVTHTADANGNIVVTLTLSNGNSSTFTVPRGDTGATGPQGLKGDTGSQGPKGDTGATGTFSAADLQRVTALESENALLCELVNGIDAPIYRETSGNPATFADGYPANVKALSVTLTPAQSGSGAPYPPGGGKNLFNYDAWKSVAVNNGTGVFENYGVTITATARDCYTYFQNNTYPAAARIPVTEGETYILSWECDTIPSGAGFTLFPNGAAVNHIWTTDPNQRSLEYTATEGITYLTFRVGTLYDGTTFAVRNIMVCNASETDPTFAPYSNVRPISGVSSVSVRRYGKNLFPQNTVSIPRNTGSVSVSFPENLHGGIYTFSANVSSSYQPTADTNDGCLVHVLYVNGAYAQHFLSPNARGSFTINSGVEITGVRFYCANTYTNSYNNSGTFTDIQFQSGSVATDYQPHDALAVPLTDSNGDPLTVYGGTLNVTTGELTVTRANIASYNGESLPGVWMSDRDVYAAGTSPTAGAQVVYELATPVTYQLTPQQLATLSGYNNVTADAGTLSVTYRADTALSLGGD